MDKPSIYTIIVSIISTVIGAPVIFNFVHDYLTNPNIIIGITFNSNLQENAIVEVKNSGNEAARFFSLTVNSPLPILNYDLFVTENLADVDENKKDNNTLQISIPRFMQGPGSLIKIDLNFTSKFDLPHETIFVYSIFDQGSAKVFGNVKETFASNSGDEELSRTFYLLIFVLLIPISFGLLTWLNKRNRI